MSTMFVHQLRYNPVWAGLLLVLLCSGPAWAQGISPAAPRQLYLLSATTTQHAPESYPVLLYRVGKNSKLELAREVVPQAAGVRSVHAWGDRIFALQPNGLGTTASIIHTDEPMRVDDIVFSHQNVATVPSATTVAAPPGSGLVLLAFWITNIPDPAHVPEHINATVARVSSSPAGAGPRVQYDSWSDYAYIRNEGAPGGPNYVADKVGSAKGDDVTIDFFGHSAVIDKLPPQFRQATNKIVPIIFGASPEYLILTRRYSSEEVRAGTLGDSLELHVHDRIRDRWSLIRSEGNSPTIRLFGPWLATIVGNWSENHGPNPGRENERAEKDKTDRLPPVQTLFASFRGRHISLPGILVLQNLADGRKIRIETGQEDSEILRVEADTVLYRINDTIYQAKIVGDQLKDSTVVVKDEDVPEIHWAFWSK